MPVSWHNKNFVIAIHVQKKFIALVNGSYAIALLLSKESLGQKNNTLVSGNAGDEKILHPGDCKKFLYQFSWIFLTKFTLKETVMQII